MIPKGKGIYLWQIIRVAGGDPVRIAKAAANANLTHVVIKVADGKLPYNYYAGVDRVPGVVSELRSRGIQPWGWQYIYGSDPVAEAKMAIQRVKQFSLDGFVVNAEGQFKAPGMAAAAKTYMKELRKGLPNLTVGLSSYRYPSVHKNFPWKAFLNYCDFNMPQVYWLEATNPGQQLVRCVTEFQSLMPGQPIVPTGSAFKWSNWTATPQQLIEFLKKARELNLRGANFWEMASAQDNDGSLWKTISDYNWETGQAGVPQPPPSNDDRQDENPPPAVPSQPKIITRTIDALNSGDASKATVLYEKNISQLVSAGRAYKGRMNIFSYYHNFFKKTLPTGKFKLLTWGGSNGNFTLEWSATSSKGKVKRGKDTILMSSENPNLILRHTTVFTVAKGLPPFPDPDVVSEAGPIPV